MNENRLLFGIAASDEFLSHTLEDALDAAISSEPLQVSGVEVNLKRIGEAAINIQGKHIDIDLPLSIDIKRPAGLFTVEGSGALRIKLQVLFDISNSLKLTTKSELKSHDWIEKPVLEIGALNIPVETLVNLVLNHHESIITAKLDNALKAFSDLNIFLTKALKEANVKINENDLKGNVIRLNVTEIALEDPVHKNNQTLLNGWLKPEVWVNPEDDIIDVKPNFSWIAENHKEDYGIAIPLNLPFGIIEKEVLKILNGLEVGGKQFYVADIHINYRNDSLDIELTLDDPIKAQVFITAKPVYNEIEGKLFLEDLDVKVNPSNLIYKLTAPLVNISVENGIKKRFPYDIDHFLNKEVKSKIPNHLSVENAEIDIDYTSLSLSAMVFEHDKILATLRIGKPLIAIVH